jgi:hypothetical protein
MARTFGRPGGLLNVPAACSARGVPHRLNALRNIDGAIRMAPK